MFPDVAVAGGRNMTARTALDGCCSIEADGCIDVDTRPGTVPKGPR
jgi:hypothetical protein